MDSLFYKEDDEGLNRNLIVNEIIDKTTPVLEVVPSKPNVRWYMELLSILLFVLGSTLFLYLAVLDYQYMNNKVEMEPSTIVFKGGGGDLNPTDDPRYSGHLADDDYLFGVASNGWSRYQLIYFLASFCMLLTGFCDLVEDRAAFHALLILAGGFGVASAIYVEDDPPLCITLDFVSVHLYLIEGIAVLYGSYHRELPKEKKYYRRVVMLADGLFVFGSLLDVVLAWLAERHLNGTWNPKSMIVWTLSNAQWLISSFIAFGIFVYDTIQDKKVHDVPERSHALLLEEYNS